MKIAYYVFLLLLSGVIVWGMNYPDCATAIEVALALATFWGVALTARAVYNGANQ